MCVCVACEMMLCGTTISVQLYTELPLLRPFLKSEIWETNRPPLSSAREATRLFCIGSILQQN